MGNSESTPASTGLVGKGTPVVLNVYVPVEGGSGFPGFGVYHTGIEIFGREYCFAGNPNATGHGICTQTPRETPDESHWVFKESIALGNTLKSQKEIENILIQLQDEFPANEYHVIHKNCNSFSEAVCKKLGLKFPAHINRAANFGKIWLDNPIEDRKRREAERKADEEKKKNPFLSSTGHSLSGDKDKPKSDKKASSPTTSSASTSSSSSTGGSRKNPWSDPNFRPAKAASAK